MSSSTEQPTGTEGPLRYAPRGPRDDLKAARDPQATKGGALRGVDSDTDDILRDRPFPLRDIRSPLIPPLPSASVSDRRPFAVMREMGLLALVAVVAVACSFFALAIYPTIFPREADTRAVTPPPQVAVNEPPAPTRFDERAVPAPAAPAIVSPPAAPAAAVSPPAAAPAVVTQPAPGPFVRGVTDTEIRFGIAAAFSGSARELGRQMKLGIDAAFGLINDGRRNPRPAAAADRGRRWLRADPHRRRHEAASSRKTRSSASSAMWELRPRWPRSHTPSIRRRCSSGHSPARASCGAIRPTATSSTTAPATPRRRTPSCATSSRSRRIKPEKIAVFAQQDSYGDAGFAGVSKAMRALRGGEAGPILRLDYKRNTVDVEEAVATLRLHKIADQGGGHGADLSGGGEIHREDARPLSRDDLHQRLLRRQHRVGPGADASGAAVSRKESS